MLFPTPEFAIFFFVVFSAAWALRDRMDARKLVLLAASYFFYGYWDWRFLALLAFSSAFNYLAGLLLAAKENQTMRRRITAVAVALNLAILGVFKYYNFFIDSLADFLLPLGLGRDMPFLEIVLPIGISFFTFQGISYVVDVYRGHLAPVRSPLDLFLYISLFPQLVAGPIVRASHFLPQLSARPELKRTTLVYGFLLILNGMLKKTVIAHYIAVDLVDPVFASPDSAGSLDLVVAAYAYAIQVYCDFSAYSDIAIGTAALLGFRFRKNFDRPFSATSLQQMWQRWHISLSTWLRDYLYRTLRGKQRDAGWRMHRNVFLTMLLGGLWHGASWTFVCWGAIHGIALSLERSIKGRWHDMRSSNGERVAPAPAAAILSASAGWLFTFTVFALAAIFFRSPDLSIVRDYYARMLSFSSGADVLTPFTLALIVGAVAVQFLPGDLIERSATRLRNIGAVALGVILGAGLLVIGMIGPQGVAPFIYFQF